jgi:hypothetical protein
MTAKARSLFTVVSEAVETAAGYALVVVGIYSAIFVDVTGSGSLWKSMHHFQTTTQESLQSPNATHVIKVPTQPLVAKVHEERMLAVFDEEPPTGTVAAVYQDPAASGLRPSAAFTDTPADPSSGKTWKRGLKGVLRNFTVYGNGEQTSSASSAAGAASAGAAGASAPKVVAAEGSAARAETVAAARPGVGTRMSRGALAASETSRNVR